MAESKLNAPDVSDAKYAPVADNATKLADNTCGLGYDDAGFKKPNGAPAKLLPKNTKRSLFNGFNVIALTGGNYPVTDGADVEPAWLKESKIATAIDLISKPRGACIYTPADFLLCARYGLPINRMITLRRFPTPVDDNICMVLTDDGQQDDPVRGTYNPDIGRLVTYMDQNTNKLSDILGMSWGLNWEQRKAEVETIQSPYEPGSGGFSTGWMSKLNKWLDSGSANEMVQGSNRLNYNPVADSNKIHGPVDSIAETYMRGIGLKHEMSFEITFDYEMRSFNGINQKTMFMDALANVLAVTMNNGRFWGGARVWVGAKPSNLARKLQFLNPKTAEEFLANGKIAVTNFMKEMAPKTGSGKEAAVNVLKTILKNGMNLALGKFLDMVGRPAMPQMNSLLRGDPVGDWHLTIGNPLNPIMSVGNLILEDTKIEFGESLGYDDFPTSFKVTCTLKGGQPRDRAGIESMFNNGYGRLYMPASKVLRRKKSGNSTSMGQGNDKEGVGGNETDFPDDAYKKAADAYSEFLRDVETGNDVADVDFETDVSQLNVITEEAKAKAETTLQQKTHNTSYLSNPLENDDGFGNNTNNSFLMNNDINGFGSTPSFL